LRTETAATSPSTCLEPRPSRPRGADLDGLHRWRERAAFDGDEQAPRLEEAGLDPACRIQLSGALAVESVPVLQGDLVETAPAVRHATLARPVAFLGEEAVVPLLRLVSPGQTPEAVVRTWSERLPAELGWEIMHWLWRHRVVVPARGLQHPAGL